MRKAAAGRHAAGDSLGAERRRNRRTHLGQLTGQMLPGEATADPSGHNRLQCCWISVLWSASGTDRPAGWHVGGATHLLTRRAKQRHLPTSRRAIATPQALPASPQTQWGHSAR